MRKFLLLLFVILLVPAAYVVVAGRSHTDIKDLPPLESGDLIFETVVNNPQALPIMIATASIYTHVGLVHKHPDGYTVIHATNPVEEVPLRDFVRLGWGEKIKIMRYTGLNDAQREAIARDAEHYIGRGYNFVFYMKNPEIYCSELPYLAFGSQHVELGKLEKIGDLNMNNFATRKLFKERWRMHPACQARDMDYDTCWKEVLGEPIITPASLAHDANLTQIYSNYLF